MKITLAGGPAEGIGIEKIDGVHSVEYTPYGRGNRAHVTVASLTTVERIIKAVREGARAKSVAGDQTASGHYYRTAKDLEDTYFADVEPDEPEPQPADEPSPEPEEEPEEDSPIVALFQRLGERLDAERGKVAVLTGRVEQLEQTVASLKGENTALSGLVAELEAELESFEDTEPTENEKTQTLPDRLNLNGKSRPAEYKDRFTTEYGRRQPHEQAQVIRALQNLDRIKTYKASKVALDKRLNVPEDTLVARAGVYRFAWRPAKDRVVLYALVHRGDSVLGYSEK